MCIIIYKPKNKKLPSEEVLKTCFINNDDGAGFMYAKDGRVQIIKGFVTFNEFYKELKKVYKREGKGASMVLHFRISTQGGIRKDNCHPFPVSDKMDDLRRLKTTAKLGVAHNGIISLTSTYKKGITFSDTMAFIKDYFYLIAHNLKSVTDFSEEMATLTERLIDDSRLAIMDGDGGVKLLGDGWLTEDGCYFSNSSYLARRYTSLRAYSSSYLPFSASNEWEGYRTFDGYSFSPYYCPLTEEGDEGYCEECLNFNKCYNGGDEVEA